MTIPAEGQRSASPVPRAASPSLVLLWAAIAVLGVLLTFALGGFTAIYDVDQRLLTQTLTVGVIVTWMIASLLRPRAIVIPWMAPAILVALAALLVATVVSPWPRFAWSALFGAVGIAAIYALVVRLLASDWLRPRMRTLVALLVVAVALMYLGQLTYYWVQWYQAAGVVALPPLRPAYAGLFYGTPNIPAGIILLVGPVVLAWVATSRRPIWAFPLGGLFGVVIYASGSRGAWVGLAAAVVVAGFLTLWRRRAYVRNRLLGTRGRRITLAVAVIVACAIVAIALPRVATRLNQSGSAIRFAFWEDTFRLILANPLLGTGPGTWPFAHLGYANPDRALVIVSHAHNIPLQIAANAGLIGIIAAAAFVVVLLRLIQHAFDRMPAAEVIAIAAGLVGILAQCLFDNFSNLPVTVMGVAFLIAWLDPGVPWPARPVLPRFGLQRAVAFSGLLVAALVIVVLAPWAVASAQYVGAIQAAGKGDTAAAVSSLRSATSFDPNQPIYWLQLGAALDKTGDLRGAIAAYEQAGSLTGDPFAWVQAALIAATANDASGARTDLARATAHGVGDPWLALNAGRVEELLGDAPQARDYYATALAANPWLAGATFWSDPQRLTPRSAQIEAADARIGTFVSQDADPAGYRYDLWVAAGSYERARQALGSAADTPWIKDFLDAMEGQPGALVQLKQVVKRQPSNVDAVAALARAAGMANDPDAARYQQWASLLDVTADRLAIPQGIAPNGADAAIVPRDLAPEYATQMYLRQVPDDGVAQEALRFGDVVAGIAVARGPIEALHSPRTLSSTAPQ
jgi:O-antigen ligase/tetratricopeptide (TPR) repeat protein